MYYFAHNSAIIALCRQHRVQRLTAFGSVLTPAFGPASDVDLVATFEPMPVEEYADNYLALKFALEQVLQRPVDLLEAQALRNPYFRARVEATQQVVFDATAEAVRPSIACLIGSIPASSVEAWDKHLREIRNEWERDIDSAATPESE